MQGSQGQKSQINGTIQAGHFLQSKEWEEFQRYLGRDTFRVDGVLITKLPLILGKNYLYSAGCVTCNVKQLRDLAKKEDAVFLKFEPMTEDKALAQELIGAGFLKSKKEVQPQRTIILDLTKSEEELLAAMHGKTRYNIRVAQKHGIQIKVAGHENIDDFWSLIQKTAERDTFSTHTKEYYQKILKLSFIELCTAEYQDKIIAANIILLRGERATYLHGASDYESRTLMAPYLLHWEIIRCAKNRGSKEYDLWGIDEKKWPGVTRFKRGFGGREAAYIGSYDYVYKPLWYRLYSLRNFLKHYT